MSEILISELVFEDSLVGSMEVELRSVGPFG